MKKLIVLFVLALLPLMVSAFTGEAEIDGINYFVNTDEQTAEIRPKSDGYSGDVVIPPTIEYEGVTCDVILIADFTFNNCTDLTSITIPNSVTSIGNCVLRYCSNLTSIVMGNGIKDIKRGAFSFCTGLTDFYCYAENVPSIDSNAFIYTDYANVTLHVPSASISSYKSKALWNGFKNIVALTDSDPKPTGISSVNYISLKDDVHYELSGRKIQKPQQGIYIINGKKYIKK